VRQLRDEGVLCEERPGLYELQQTVTAYMRYLRASSKDLNSERAGLTRIKKDIAELRLKKEKGKLHSTEDVERALTTMLMNFRTRIMAIPAKTAPDLAAMTDQADVFDRLKRETDEALDELSDYRVAFAIPEKDAECDEEE